MLGKELLQLLPNSPPAQMPSHHESTRSIYRTYVIWPNVESVHRHQPLHMCSKRVAPLFFPSAKGEEEYCSSRGR